MADQVFMGYSSHPNISRETLHRGAQGLTATGLVNVTSWEDLKIGGRIVISAILDAINESSLCIFDVSVLNPNVIYELGYAIGRGKRIWLLLDKTDSGARERWQQFRLLASIGYRGWASSDDIRAAFLTDYPHLSEETIYDQLIEPSLTEGELSASLFYLPIAYDTEANIVLSRRLGEEARHGVRLVSADPTESALNPMTWYAQKINESSATIIHFAAPRRDLAPLQNARAALVAGLATALERPVLMLAEEDYTSPFDYQERLKIYASATRCGEIANEWLKDLHLQPDESLRTRRLQLATELRGLRFGEHVAENESETLSDYFVETAAFDDVLTSSLMLFVGRKGAGKTANMLQAAARLRQDARNLVVVIKPASYEFEALVSLLQTLPGELKTYSIEALWKFLLQSEIARVAAETIETRPVGVPYTEAERNLIRFIDESSFGLREEFAVRFEKTVLHIRESGLAEAGSLSDGRNLLNEALHTTAIRELRGLLGPIVKGRQRVAVLIDNLDKAWDRQADLDALSQLLLGLLGAVGRTARDFEREDYWRNKVKLSLAVFLRNDIYTHIQRVAREPDKIPTRVLEWSDPNALLRIIEERFLAVRPKRTSAEELWERFFCEEVKGMRTRDYIISRILPRPRDIVYFCNAAVISAVNARRESIAPEDIEQAERSYSQFAFEALLVENGITIRQMEDVLLEFAGLDATFPASQATAAVSAASIPEDKVASAVDRLKTMSFLGLEVALNSFEYVDGGPDTKRVEAIARRYAQRNQNEARVSIHPAFRSYLGVEG